MPVLQFTRPEIDYESRWCIVTSCSGQVAVIAFDDVCLLGLNCLIESATPISLHDAQNLKTHTPNYMSATCRLKSGESDRVG